MRAREPAGDAATAALLAAELVYERAGLARLRGDADGMACDLTRARRLFAEMGVTGWDACARSIEA